MDSMILITGANGFVGRHAIERLSRKTGLSIIAVDVHDGLIPLRGSSPAIREYLSGDLSDKEFIASIRSRWRFDCILHLAAIISQTADMDTYLSIMQSNIQATFLLLETAREHGARLVFPSTALIYGNQKAPFREELPPDPGDFYSLSKQMCEQLIRFYGVRYNVPSVVFRIGILYGPSQANAMFIPSLVASLLASREFPMTGGEQVRDFVYIDDLIAAIKIALDRPGVTGVYNIGTGKAPTLRQVALKAEELTGVHGMVKFGAIPYRDKESWEYCLDTAKAENELKWRAVTTIDEGLAKTIAWEKFAGNCTDIQKETDAA